MASSRSRRLDPNTDGEKSNSPPSMAIAIGIVSPFFVSFASIYPEIPNVKGKVATLLIIILVVILYVTCIRPRISRTSRNNKSHAEEKTFRFFSRFRSASNRGHYSAQLQPSTHLETESLHVRGRTLSDVELANEPTSSTVTATSPITTVNTTTAPNSDVDRHTSVRSIMTLPAYSSSARPTEQILAREGERAGIDVVIEAPESRDEEDARREYEMNSLYQIRLARRQEVTAREERRRRRQEARERGDAQELARIRAESERDRAARSQGVTQSAQLIAEHHARPTRHRVSSVSYLDVGQVRHDGSRLRATSNDSDRGMLLASAAPMASSSTTSLGHARDRSVSSHRSSLSSVNEAPTADMTNEFQVIPLDYDNFPTDQRPPLYERLSARRPPPYSAGSARSEPFPPLNTTSSVPSIHVTTAVSPIPRSTIEN